MVRDFEKKDLGRVMEIWLSANLDAHGFIRTDYWQECFRSSAEAIMSSDVRVVEENGSILGFIGISGENIEGLFVDGEYRSKGIGKALMDKAKEAYPRLTLCVYEKNSGAVKFYEREGFRRIRKTLDVSAGETEIFMRWDAKKIKFELG